MTDHDAIRAIEWRGDCLRLLDQRRLPAAVVHQDCRSVDDVAGAIRDMVVRGAPAIGITAAYGCVLAARAGELETGIERLASARPTAVNLDRALQRMRRLGSQDPERLLAEARAIHEEDVEANRAMGRAGASLIEPGYGAVTHCNTGSLATGGFGTALGVVRQAWGEGRLTAVYAGETRPWGQGARLTAWELAQDGIPVNVIADSAAASLMRGGGVGWVIVGADRVAANGDVANKIGTYSLALAARTLGVRMMVVAPATTLDPAVPSGDAIPIETRAARELLGDAGTMASPNSDRIDAWNPVFDITPAQLIDVLVTDQGIVEHPDQAGLRALMDRVANQELAS